MADIVKEIFNGSISYTNWVDGKQPIATTNGTKTLVIKDVAVETNTYTTAPSIVVNNTKVADLTSSLTGSEIVGTNSSVELKANSPIVLDVNKLSLLYVDPNTANYYPALSPSSVFVPSLTGSVANVNQGTQDNTTGFTNSGSVAFAHLVNGWWYYYTSDGNSTTNFYKRRQSDGTQNTLGSNSYGCACYDGGTKFYSYFGGEFKVHDAVAQTSTVLLGSSEFGSHSSYPWMAYANGIVFVQSYTGNNIYWYNVATNTYGAIGGVSHSSNSNNATVFYDSTTYQYRIVLANTVTTYTSNYYYIDIQSNAGKTSFTLSNYGAFTAPQSMRINQFLPAGKTNIILGFSGVTASIYSIDKTLTPTLLINVASASFNGSYVGTGTLTAATAAEINANAPQLKLRITGVESTL